MLTVRCMCSRTGYLPYTMRFTVWLLTVRFLFPINIWFARPRHCGEDWEAGENPALPRNCKRGHAVSHWETGKAGCGRWTQVLTREPGDRREPSTPTLSRVKEIVMRFFGIVVGVLSLVAGASAAELKVKVVDPRSAAVSGAQVILLNAQKTVPLAVENTSAE